MNQSVIFAVFTILSLRCESLSSRLHEQNFSDIEQILVQTFKKKLLKELGFSSVPNISAFKAVKFPPIYAHLVEAENSKLTQQSEEDEDDFHAKTKRIFLFPEEGKLYFYFAGEIACEAITAHLIMKSSIIDEMFIVTRSGGAPNPVISSLSCSVLPGVLKMSLWKFLTSRHYCRAIGDDFYLIQVTKFLRLLYPHGINYYLSDI